jgi:hypothetical protein
MAAARLFRFIKVATLRRRCFVKIAKDIGLSIEDFLAGNASQQPNTALQPSADESVAPKKPSEPGRR